jgi:hypothetical protein
MNSSGGIKAPAIQVRFRIACLLLAAEMDVERQDGKTDQSRTSGPNIFQNPIRLKLEGCTAAALGII